MLNHESARQSVPPSPVPSALGSSGPRIIRFFGRIFNPLVLGVAGRRWMPLVGVLHHRGWRTGRAYATPVGMRRAGDDFFVPLTLGDESHWYRNVRAADKTTVTCRGHTTQVGSPAVAEWEEATSAFPRYERALFRRVGIRHFLKLSAT